MNLFDYISEYALENAGNYAIVDEERAITYGQLWEHIKSNQITLKKNGYFATQKVIVRVHRQLDFIISLLSLLSIGCWVAPVAEDITQDELDKIASLTGATIFPFQTFELYNLSEAARQAIIDIPDSDNAGIYHLTSGSTGAPKLCIRTLNALTAEGISFKKTFSIQSNDKVLSAPPLYHSYAFGAAFITALVSGGCIYTIDSFVPRKILKMIQKNRITILILVPTMARLLGDTHSEQKYDLSSLRVALVGAGPITKEVYDHFLNKYGITLMSNYGSTETGGIVSRLEPLPYTSIGRPMDAVEIKLCNEKGESVNPGEPGEIRVKSDSMLIGYFGLDEHPLDQEGFFPMGDIAVQDAAGYLYIKGRKKLMINVGGKKVNPYEVEEVLLGFPGVRECVVTGFCKPNGEEAVRAYIVGEEVYETAIRTFCCTKLSQHKIPSEIVFTKSLPKNKLGKIMREELKRLEENVNKN